MKETAFCGITFANPILNSSGLWCLTKENILSLKNSFLGGVVSKTCTLNPRKESDPPNYVVSEEYTVNCLNLPNFGYSYYEEISLSYFPDDEKPFIFSVNGDSLDELIEMLLSYDIGTSSKKIIEINVSCPNINRKKIIGYHLSELEMLLRALSRIKINNLILGLKLPPFLEECQIEGIVNLLRSFSLPDGGELLQNEFSPPLPPSEGCGEKYLISFLTCCNSIPFGMVLDDTGSPLLSKLVGGIGGSVVNKALGLSNVYFFNKILNERGMDIALIGCGGVRNFTDVMEYLSVGATLVQVGSNIDKFLKAKL